MKNRVYFSLINKSNIVTRLLQYIMLVKFYNCQKINHYGNQYLKVKNYF